MLLTSLGGLARTFDSGGAIALETRAAALQARWSDIEAKGVPQSDLAGLEQQWAAAERMRILGAGASFWSPGSSGILDRWQLETDAIWNRNLSQQRSAAVAAQQRLRQALAPEPELAWKERLELLSAATTPAELRVLTFDWDLQTRLVPVNRDIASAVGDVIQMTRQAAALGITTAPAPALLARADAYSLEPASAQALHADRLMGQLSSLQQDLRSRLDAAAITANAFSGASDAIARGTSYGLAVSSYQARFDADLKRFPLATAASEFAAITGDLGQIVAALQRDVDVVLNAVHVISGVRFYYQTHPLSCEEAATSMALTHQGIYLSQDQILAEMGADTRRMYVDGNGVVRWGNPYLSFVGSVNGSEHNYSGFGANYEPLVRVARAHGARIIAAGSMTPQFIYANLIAGHPVVVYATWDWKWHPRHDYLSFDGRWIPWIGPYHDSHVYTAVGVSRSSVLVNDPLRGQYWVSKRAFEAAYSDFNEAIVFA